MPYSALLFMAMLHGESTGGDRYRYMRRSMLLCLALALWGAWHANVYAATILILHQEHAAHPLQAEFMRAFRESLRNETTAPFVLHTEHLDARLVHEERYRDALMQWLANRYADTGIDVIVAAGPDALDFILSKRPRAWAEIPVVFAAADPLSAELALKRSNITGNVLRRDLRQTIELAARLLPDTRHIALIGDRRTAYAYEPSIETVIESLRDKYEIVDLRGRSISDVLERIVKLGPQSVIFYNGVWYEDQSGSYAAPRETLAELARVAPGPIFVDWAPYVGYGAAGGQVVQMRDIADDAAVRVARILDGEPVSGLPLGTVTAAGYAFDWRELRRWNIATSALPATSNVQFRPPSPWRQYRQQLVVALGAIAIQGALIALLLVERRRRRTAELEVNLRTNELGQMNRAAAMGEMSAAIAHELGQPLAAILANAEAGALLLERQPPKIDEAHHALLDIVRDDRRASGVIRRITALYRESERVHARIDVNALVTEVVRITTQEAAHRDLELVLDLDPDAPAVVGDTIQLQQVVLNLLRNAMDAIPAGSNTRRVLISTRKDGNYTRIAVCDSGVGIPEHAKPHIFDPFFTTKSQGIGMGLAISKRIVEAHHGRLSASHSPLGGAQLALELPIAEVL